MSEQGKNKKKKEQVTVRSSAAEYLNYVASVGNDEQQIEMRYEDEKHLAHTEADGNAIRCRSTHHQLSHQENIL